MDDQLQGQMNLFDFIESEESKDILEPQEDKKDYQIIKASNMEVIYERNFVEICTDSRICISATVKLLNNNMVYWSEWYTYPFLDICQNEKEAKRKYEEHLNKILDGLQQPPRFEINVPEEMEDMYLCVNGIWSCDTYAFHNGAVKIQQPIFNS